MSNRFILFTAIGLSLCACGQHIEPANSTTQPIVTEMPDTTPPGKPHFDSMGAQVGQQLPVLPVYDLKGRAETLRSSWGPPLTLLITSAYPCPKSRSTYPSAASLVEELKPTIRLAVIYVIEAHPSGDPSP